MGNRVMETLTGTRSSTENIFNNRSRNANVHINSLQGSEAESMKLINIHIGSTNK